jgi:hypothetical protein
MGKRILVVATSNVGADEINRAVGERFGSDAEVVVIAPASGLSRLDWLTNAEDDARADAASRAAEVAEALPSDAVDAGVGDTDPLQAIADALRTYDADEVVVITRGDEEASWLENRSAASADERFDVPVTQLVID